MAYLYSAKDGEQLCGVILTSIYCEVLYLQVFILDIGKGVCGRV